MNATSKKYAFSTHLSIVYEAFLEALDGEDFHSHG